MGGCVWKGKASRRSGVRGGPWGRSVVVAVVVLTGSEDTGSASFFRIFPTTCSRLVLYLSIRLGSVTWSRKPRRNSPLAATTITTEQQRCADATTDTCTQITQEYKIVFRSRCVSICQLLLTPSQVLQPHILHRARTARTQACFCRGTTPIPLR